MPVWSLGPFQQTRRRTIVSMKDSARHDMQRLLGQVLTAGVRYLQARGDIAEDIVVIPAPTTRAAARRRGGDPVTAVCLHSGLLVIPALSQLPSPDSVGLDAKERRVRAQRSVRIEPVARTQVQGLKVLVVDDVITTGATLSASVDVLEDAGASVQGCLGLSSA